MSSSQWLVVQFVFCAFVFVFGLLSYKTRKEWALTAMWFCYGCQVACMVGVLMA